MRDNRLNDVALDGLYELATRDLGLAALSTADRAVLVRRWTARAENEQATSAVFVEVGRALAECEAPEALLADAERAAEDERFHSAVCRLVAEHYAGRRVELSPPSPALRAKFTGCSPRESSLLYVVMQAALSESVAAAYLRECSSAAATELTREAIRLFLRDEIRHARLGFTFLALTSTKERALVGAALPSLLSTVIETWLSDRDYPRGIPGGHGCLEAGAVKQAVESGVRELVLPGLAELGIDTAPALRAVERAGYFGRR